jgi:D-3-phosphoglycerate dehydrogenase
MTKILIGPSTFAEHDRKPLDLLKANGFEAIDNPYKRKLTKEEVIALLSDNVMGIIAGLEPLDKEVLTRTKLKVISRCGSGMSNVDLKSAAELGIKVYCTPQGPVTAVAELTVGALLSLLRMLPVMDQELHSGTWNKKIGLQLEGKTVAIIGFGRIGRKVAQLLKNFGTKLIAVDPALSGIVEGTKIVSFDEAVKDADIISLHTSGEEELFGEDEFKYMKNGAVILNAARGGLINEQALINALDRKKISGAWLDTFVVEPYNGPLTKYRQVILTPHVGSYTSECRRSMELEAAGNLITGFKEIHNEYKR